VPSQSDILVAWLAEHILVFRPADERRFKAEFGYDNRKGVGPCDRGLSGLGQDDVINSVKAPPETRRCT
jgi:hypothetical protein